MPAPSFATGVLDPGRGNARPHTEMVPSWRMSPRPLALLLLGLLASACGEDAPPARHRPGPALGPASPAVLEGSNVRPTAYEGYSEGARIVADACPEAGREVCAKLAALMRAVEQGRCADARRFHDALRLDHVAYEAAIPWMADRAKLRELMEVSCAAVPEPPPRTPAPRPPAPRPPAPRPPASSGAAHE